MSLRSWIRSRLGGRSAEEEVTSGRPQDTGGSPNPSSPDSHSTTGTTPNETFVGRAGGDDPGYLETGAEKRAEEGEGPSDDPKK